MIIFMSDRHAASQWDGLNIVRGGIMSLKNTLTILRILVFGLINHYTFYPFAEWITMAEPGRGLFTRTISLVPTFLFLIIILFQWLLTRSRWNKTATRNLKLWGAAFWGLFLSYSLCLLVPTLIMLFLTNLAVTLILLGLLAVMVLIFVRTGVKPVHTVILFNAVFCLGFWHYFDIDRLPDEAVIEGIRDTHGVIPFAMYGRSSSTVLEVPSDLLGEGDSRITKIPLNGYPGSAFKYLAASSDGKYIYATGGMEPLVKGKEIYPLFRVDLETSKIDVLPLPTGTQAIEYDDKTKALWVGNEGGEGFFRIDVKAYEHPKDFVREVEVFGNKPHPMDKNQVNSLFHWFPSEMDPEVFLIDRRNDRLIVFFEDADRDYFHVDRGITVWKLSSMDQCYSIFSVGTGFVEPSPSTKNIYNARAIVPPGIEELEYETLEIKRRMYWPVSMGFDVDQESGDIFLVNLFPGRLHKIDPVKLESTDSMHIGIGLKLVLYDPYRDLVYIGNYLTGDFYIVSWKKKKILATVNVGNRNQSIILVPVSHRLFTTTNYGLFEIDVDSLVSRTARVKTPA